MVLGKLPVPGRPTNLDNSGARAYCACSRCGWGCLDIFLSSITSPFSLPLRETARYRLKYCLKGPLNPKQPTNRMVSDTSVFQAFTFRFDQDRLLLAWVCVPLTYVWEHVCSSVRYTQISYHTKFDG